MSPDVDAALTINARRVMRRRIWARAVLTSPLWIWWALFPALAVAAIVGLAHGVPGPRSDGWPDAVRGAYR